MIQDPFEGVVAFLAVARHQSFTAAAAELGVTTTAASKQIKQLEARLGVLLFQRTTRRVALTEAGQGLLARVRPAAGEITDALGALGAWGQRPRGTLRLTAPHIAVPLALDALVPRMRRAHPEVTLEISLDDAMVDLVRAGYDAGVRSGETIERDMVAVPLTPQTKWSIVGAPAYFARAGRPRTPDDLARHECVRQRMLSSQTIYRWELMRGRREVSIEVGGGLVLDNVELIVAMARAGLGLAYVADALIEDDLATGRLQRTLEAYLRPGPGLQLYFPAGAQTQPKLRAFIDVIAAWVKEQKRTRG